MFNARGESSGHFLVVSLRDFEEVVAIPLKKFVHLSPEKHIYGL